MGEFSDGLAAMKRSINAHEMRAQREGGQTRVGCLCALLRERLFNRTADATTYYAEHVRRAERAARARC